MQQQLDLNEVMPLFAPQYNKEYLSQFMLLKLRIEKKCFDAVTNSLAEILLKDDPSNYNAWYAKKMYIIQEKPDLHKQQSFANSCLGEKAKSFQVWEQKRFLTDLLNSHKEERQLVQQIIRFKDAKNYHAWSYRIWLTQKIKNFEQELLFANQMITEDNFNNSAWSYRFFLIGKILEGQNYRQNIENKNKILLNEVQYALKIIKIFKANKASWNYLRGLFPSIKLKQISSQNVITPILISRGYQQYPQVMASCLSWWDEVKKNYHQRKIKDENQLFSIQKEILTTLVHIYSQDPNQHQFARNVCQELAKKDRQRAFYWKWISLNL